MGMFFNEDINTLFVGGSAVSAAYAGSEQVWPVGLPPGTVFNFEYTGSVQSVELPKGKYKLQCWGAQGGNVTGTYAVNGSKGGYSEGVLTLTEKTTLYVFVGGQGTSYTSSASQTSATTVNGGWNGGGAAIRTSRYNASGIDGRSFPRGGGGATDISTVTSSLSYSSGRTTRDSASLLARCIVAGGGAGASARYTSEETTSTSTVTVASGDLLVEYLPTWNSSRPYGTRGYLSVSLEAGKTYTASSPGFSGVRYFENSSGTWLANSSYTPSSSGTYRVRFNSSTNYADQYITINITTTESTTSTSTSSSKSNTTMQGGGTSGKGQYPGTQSSAGSSNAGFGLGANQTASGYRYCAGGGGGGWYGGGTNQSDSSTSYISYSGGGSGFVNTSANASYRPSGYTGLQLDSGTTTAGNSSFESPIGGSETGHSGSGYARITVLDDSGQLPSGYTQLEYIESTGTQYIDTEFIPNQDTKVIAKLTAPIGITNMLFGARASATSKFYGFVTSNSGWHASGYNSHIVLDKSFNIDGVIEINKDKNITKINGILAAEAEYEEFVSPCSMMICALNQNGTILGYGKTKIYSFQIYDNNILIRDYVPVQNNEGIAGLYDKVNNKFYSSASDTDFTGA